jgi:ubiquinone/menaquinone biosynthesis C-methylase UbiE
VSQGAAAASTDAALGAVQCWLSDAQLHDIYTARYWNDIEEEKKKEWWIEDGDYERCRNYLQQGGLLGEYRQAETFVTDAGAALQVADLAAGIGWTSALLSKLPNVATVHAIEISRHRLERLFPHSVMMLAGEPHKIRRYLGSFYDLQLPPGTIDVMFLSHAFHHADRPLHLLIECDRVLKPGGRMVVVGEHQIGPRAVVRRCLSVLLRQGNLTTDFRRLFPPDPVLGDHYYRPSDYRLMFGSLGYRFEHRIAPSGSVLYIADKIH